MMTLRCLVSCGHRHLLARPCTVKRIAIVAAVVAALAMAGVPVAHAEQYVRTESGKVRCDVQADKVGCQYLPGFPQAPVDPPPPCPPPPGTYLRCGGEGFHWDIANVTAGGAFSWMNGNLAAGGSASPQKDVVLNYGQTYHLQGWTISPNDDGTRFTNDGTGHGMFVSIENVAPF